jgi:hypothetical protein
MRLLEGSIYARHSTWIILGRGSSTGKMMAAKVAAVKGSDGGGSIGAGVMAMAATAKHSIL